MVRVLWAGKTRDPHLAALADRYLERIRHYAPFRMDEIAAGRGGRPERVLHEEADRFLARLPESAFIVVLDEGGLEMTSEGLARWLERRLATGSGDTAFVLGGHAGLAARVLDRAAEKLSLSKLTLTHEMARVLFLEQIYRAFTILRGESYHHGNIG